MNLYECFFRFLNLFKVIDTDVITTSTYGFGNNQSDVFQKLTEESSELFEKLDIASVPNRERPQMRIDFEKE